MLKKSTWRRHWNILKRFSSGYDPRAGVVSQSISRAFDSMDPHTAEEAYWIFQSRGLLVKCSDVAKFDELLMRKAAMDLTVSMWKDEILDLKTASSVSIRVLAAQAIVIELAGTFPVSFLNNVGLLAMVGLTIKQIGLRRGKTRATVELNGFAQRFPSPRVWVHTSALSPTGEGTKGIGRHIIGVGSTD